MAAVSIDIKVHLRAFTKSVAVRSGVCGCKNPIARKVRTEFLQNLCFFHLFIQNPCTSFPIISLVCSHVGWN